MQISKIFIVAGILMFGLTLLRADEDNPAQAAARAALNAKISEMNNMAPTTNMMAVPMTNSESSAMMPESTSSMPMMGNSETKMMMTNLPTAEIPLDTNSTGYTQNKPWKKEKMRTHKMEMMEMQPANTNSMPMESNYSSNTNSAPMSAPALPISTTKEERLQALDAKYKADQISPQDYFQQREEILKEQ